MKELYLLRHGDTGLSGRYIGSTDAPVTKEGQRQVVATGRSLSKIGFTKILSSPMLRCRQTLQFLDLEPPCEFWDALREIDFGRWEGQNFQEVQKSDQHLVDSWVQEPETFTFPDGESLVFFRTRVAEAKNRLEQMEDEKILLIAHGGVIRNLLCMFLGLDLNKYLLFDVKPGCYCTVQLFSEGGVLTGFNLKG